MDPRTLATPIVAFLSAAAAAQTVPATVPAPASPSAFVAALRAAAPGDVVRTSFADAKALPTTLPVTRTPTAGGAAFAFSDRPEYFRAGDGIASQDVVQPGRVRFYTYHVPVPAEGKPRRVLTIFENLGDAEATLAFAAHSEPEPSGDYHAMAKRAVADLFGGVGANVVTIPPHGHHLGAGVAPIDRPDLLVHGLWEFTTDRPLRLTVAQVTASGDLEADVAKVATLPKLPMLPYGKAIDKSGRGVFANADFDVALDAPYDTASGPAQVQVANGKSDPWLPGVDGISGDATTNKGNYGVVYHMKLKWRSTDGRGVAVLMTGNNYDPKACGVLASTVRVNDGTHPGGIVGLPRDAVRFHGVPEACVIQTYAAPAGGGEGTIDLTYTPPGACCLPTPILLVPIDK